MEECAPLCGGCETRVRSPGGRDLACDDDYPGRQGLYTLVHFSAQPEPFLSLLSLKHLNHLTFPQKVLTSSREVDECKPRAGGVAGSLAAPPGELARSPAGLIIMVGRRRMTPS